MSEKSFGALLIEGLEEAIAYEQGTGPARTTSGEITARDVHVDAPPAFDGARVRAVRQKFAVSQRVFAEALNVSDRTVKAWEQGARAPDGPSRRLLELAEEFPEALLGKVHGIR
jgi:putative transcriptional regulator